MTTTTVKTLNAQINLAIMASIPEEAQRLIALKEALLVNGYNPPIPQKFLNQRQIRKRKRQTQKH